MGLVEAMSDAKVPTPPQCRYKCGHPVTHFCEQCASGISGLSGFYCETHAARHNEEIKKNQGTLFAERLKNVQ